jgi:hypothetical protein
MIVENEHKARYISLAVLIVSLIISALLYFVFHIVFIFLIFIPSVIYYFLTKRDQNGNKKV